MPIYEYYCSDCHRLFNFFARTISQRREPACPRCGRQPLERQVSAFAMTGRHRDEGGGDDFPVDDARMEQALATLAADAEGLDENNPRDAVKLMKKFSALTGVEYGESMEEAMQRMEAGEDMESIENDMGDALNDEDAPFLLPGQKKGGSRSASAARPPSRDPKLYDL
jgi:putative FmdB family regulatory protein